MKRRSNTKQPHDPHVLFLDEGISGDELVTLLTKGKLSVRPFESLLKKNKKVPDDRVIEAVAKANYILLTKDDRMETEWVGDIIRHCAKVILLTDDAGGPMNWASAMICSYDSWSRILLDHPKEPVTIRVGRTGKISKLSGSKELTSRKKKIETSRIIRAKRSGLSHRSEVRRKPV